MTTPNVDNIEKQVTLVNDVRNCQKKKKKKNEEKKYKLDHDSMLDSVEQSYNINLCYFDQNTTCNTTFLLARQVIEVSRMKRSYTNHRVPRNRFFCYSGSSSGTL